MAQISPDPFQLPPSPEPTRWEKFTSSLAWLFKKIFAPLRFLYTATWHWKVSKQGPDTIDETARRALHEEEKEEGGTARGEGLEEEPLPGLTQAALPPQAVLPPIEQPQSSPVQAFTELLTTMKQAKIFKATVDCPLPFSHKGNPCNVWINRYHGITVESMNAPWFQLSISEDGKDIYYKCFHEGTLKETLYTLPEGQDVLQEYVSIIQEATRATQQAQNPNPTITPAFTVENGRELVQLLQEGQKLSFPLSGGMTGCARKNQYGGVCIQIGETGQRITLKDSGEMYYPEASPDDQATRLTLKKIISDRSDMLLAALAKAKEMASPPAAPLPLAPPPALPPKVTPLPQPQDFSSITSCFPQSMQEEVSLWGPQSVSFDAEGQQFSASVEKSDQGTKIEFTNQQTREKISISFNQDNIVTAVYVNGSPAPITEQINRVVKEGVSAIRISTFLFQWNVNVRIKDTDLEAEGRNNVILSTLIQDPSISDQWLYTFLTEAPISPTGGWFFNNRDVTQPRPLAMVFEKHRKHPVGGFYEKMKQAKEPDRALDQQVQQGDQPLQEFDIRWAQANTLPEKIAVLRDLLQGPSNQDSDIFLFLIRNHIHFGDYISERGFSQYRTLYKRINPTYRELLRDKSQPLVAVPHKLLPKRLDEWEENSRQAELLRKEGNKTEALVFEEKNYRILESLINSPTTIPDEMLYQFLVDAKVKLTGGWFYSLDGEPTNLSIRIAEKRNCPVTAFFKQGFLKSIQTKWNSANSDQRSELLQELIKHTLVSDDEVRQFIRERSINVPSILDQKTDELFKTHRGKPYESFMRGEAPPPVQAAQAVVAASVKVDDPLRCMITLNSHGSFSSQQFELPPNVYVVVPHPKGFDQSYVVESPPGGQSFEEMIYRPGGSAGAFLDSSCGGWRVYKPGEMVNNLRLAPWTPSTDVEEEFASWQTRASKDAEDVRRTHGGVPRFALVPARNLHGQQFMYGGELKSKVKVFGSTDLRAVIAELQKSQPGQPIVLVPFACNHDSKRPNPSVQCTLDRPTDLRLLFK